MTGILELSGASPGSVRQNKEEVMSTYLCSDLHGQHDLYIKMLEDIRFSQDDHLYILGEPRNDDAGSLEPEQGTRVFLDHVC